jgi:adenine-specific DNA-methyltransferase
MSDELISEGVRIVFGGKTPPWLITRKVKPRRQRIVEDICIGSEEEQAKNLIMEGENLQAMVSLYKYKGQIDLIVTDPPYNTGKDFRYNDRWDEDPNDPDLGDLVPEDDGSRHTKWLKFMAPRLWMMKEMLKPGGVIAICIDHRELFRLGMLMDEIFLERNRLGIINWQKTYASKNGNKHLSTATEYVLVYANNIENAKTGLMPRTDKMNSKYKSWDDDPQGLWRPDNALAKDYSEVAYYGIQSPFNGMIHYPKPNTHWRNSKKDIKGWLEEWGSNYVELDDPSSKSKSKALVLKGSNLSNDVIITPEKILSEAGKKAQEVYGNKPWPFFHFAKKGKGRPAIKRYINKVKQGQVPLTFWANDDYETPFYLGTQSWEYTESGHSQSGNTELVDILGSDHGFETVKPIKLISKIIQLWCPSNGIVMDPFAGSGTTGHAVFQLNNDTGSNRRFVLIEQGRSERQDPFAETLTAERIKRASTGKWAKGNMIPLNGGFRFVRLTQLVDSEAVMALERADMVDLLLTTYWDQENRSSSYLQKCPVNSSKYLVAKNSDGEGYFLVWLGKEKPSKLDRTTFKEIQIEAEEAGLRSRYHVYAKVWTYQGPNIEFYRIPDKILEHLGFNQIFDAFNNSSDKREEV